MTKENQDKRPIVPWSWLQSTDSRTKLIEAGFDPKTVIKQILDNQVIVDRNK